MQTAVPVIVLETSNPTAESTRLSEAIDTLSDYALAFRWIQKLCEEQYFIEVNDALKQNAVHNQRSPQNPTPNIALRSGGAAEQYAERLCHELVHYAITWAGRIWGILLTPQADMQMRLCEEACVFAITADIMHQMAHGHTVSGKENVKLWEAHLDSSICTGNAYAQNIHNGRGTALCAAFEEFYTMPSANRASYYEYSLFALDKENIADINNPNFFNQEFNPSSFAQYLPEGYMALVRHIIHMDPASPHYFDPPISVLNALPDRFIPNSTAPNLELRNNKGHPAERMELAA